MEQLWFLKWWKEYLSSVNCLFTEMSKNAQIRKRYDQFFLILLILFGLKSRSWSTQWVEIEYSLLCLIVGVGSNKMHQGGNYHNFLKWGRERVFLGHSFIIIKWTWWFFPQNLLLDHPLQLGTKEYIRCSYDFRYVIWTSCMRSI